MDLKSILRKIRRFAGQLHYEKAVLMIEMTFSMEGARAALKHAKFIEAAYINLRNASVAKREASLRTDAERRGMRLA